MKCIKSGLVESYSKMFNGSVNVLYIILCFHKELSHQCSFSHVRDRMFEGNILGYLTVS